MWGGCEGEKLRWERETMRAEDNVSERVKGLYVYVCVCVCVCLWLWWLEVKFRWVASLAAVVVCVEKQLMVSVAAKIELGQRAACSFDP